MSSAIKNQNENVIILNDQLIAKTDDNIGKNPMLLSFSLLNGALIFIIPMIFFSFVVFSHMAFHRNLYTIYKEIQTPSILEVTLILNGLSVLLFFLANLELVEMKYKIDSRSFCFFVFYIILTISIFLNYACYSTIQGEYLNNRNTLIENECYNSTTKNDFLIDSLLEYFCIIY